MSMNFGPLNRKGGERRLNVAITRSTSEMLVFASFDPSMIDLTRTSAQAVRDLKHYLEYAQRGPTALGEAVLSVGGVDSFESDFEEAVAEKLRNKGWTIHTQIGVSKFRIDLGVVHPDYPGKYLAGVECDGAAYHSSPSARDRDRIRHSILQNLGWSLVRIWSTDYWIDANRTIDVTHDLLNKILEEDRKRVEESNRCASTDTGHTETVVLDSHEIISDEVVSQIEDFEVEEANADLENADVESASKVLPDALVKQLSSKRFYERKYLPVIELVASKLIDELGPITFRHLSTKIARAHNFQRTGSQIKKQVWAAISKKRRNTKSPNGETIFWPQQIEPCDVSIFRGMTVNDEARLWQDVPYPEKLGLALSVIKENLSDPISVIAGKIGLGRLRQATKEEIEELLNEAKEL